MLENLPSRPRTPRFPGFSRDDEGDLVAQLQALLFAFADQCFHGVRPSGSCLPEQRRALLDSLLDVDTLAPTEVATWSSAQRLGLFTLLQLSVMALEGQRRRLSRIIDRAALSRLRQSSPDKIKQPLPAGLAMFGEHVFGEWGDILV